MNVFYNEKQSVGNNHSMSPSAGKPAIMAEKLKKLTFINIVSDWQPLTKKDICLVHERNHVEDILSCRKANGFGNHLPRIAASLLWTSGSFYHAARYAYVNKTVAMSPTSGFHHADYSGTMGFCTFNGLMISAALLLKEFPKIRIGIIDLDAHYGNGTADLIKRFGFDIKHYTMNDYMTESRNGRTFDKLCNVEDRDMIFYQAGADPHMDDPLGGYLTTEEMKVRDKTVFEFAKHHNIPLVWNLAGGYQSPVSKVIELHLNTVEICHSVFEI